MTRVKRSYSKDLVAQMSIRLPQVLYDQLRAFAESQGMPLATMVRRTLHEIFARTREDYGK